jgi:hypothetical protein
MTKKLQYRLYNLSIDPPTDAWPGIALQLEKDIEEKLSSKLQQAAFDPPPDAWENIVSTLQQENTARVIPIRRSWTRIAVAAVATGIIVLAGLFYLLQSESPNNTAGQTKQPPTPSIANAQPEKAAIHVDMPQPQATLSFVAAGTPIPIRMSSQTNGPVRYAHVETTGPETEELNVDGIIKDQVSVQSNTYIERKDYLTVVAPNGQPVKMSAKFSDGLGYLYNYQPVQTIDGALRSISWKQRFSNWSNKLLSNTGFIPAASNFLDIIELEELLKE